jgi:hypothetical protein
MKTRILAVLAATLLAGFSVPTTAAGHGAPAGGNGPLRTAGAVVAVAPLTTEEVDDLLWMREEEKMARDVYLALYDIWQDRIFTNIARSEQRHFDAIGMKIAYFNLTDPALPGIGLFANAGLQLLHDSLVSTGGQSFVLALTAGARIEDRDIADLLAAIEATTNPALRSTYGNLLEGSKNHLRAFVGRLRALGEDYTPQYIDPVLFDAIVGD